MFDCPNMNNLEHSRTFKIDEKKDIQMKNVQRRIKKNMTYFIQNYLIDICREKGYFFNSVYARKNPNIFQLERIQEVFYQEKFVINKEQMKIVGDCVNTYLLELSNGKDVYIKKNDENLQFMLKRKVNI